MIPPFAVDAASSGFLPLSRAGRFAAVAMGIVGLAVGIFAFASLRFELLRDSKSAIIPVVAMLGIWATGLIVARRMWRLAKQQNDTHPDA